MESNEYKLVTVPQIFTSYRNKYTVRLKKVHTKMREYVYIELKTITNSLSIKMIIKAKFIVSHKS